MTPKQKENIIQAGKIEAQVKEYAKKIVKKDMLLLELAEKIEDKIIELGGKVAFPTNLSINDIAAHYTPSYNDETKAHGLLKIDIGVQVNGFIADSAFSVDLENLKENKELIKASEEGLNAAIQSARENKSLGELGKSVQDAIEKNNCFPIINLTGHQMEQYQLHAGISILNIANSKKDKLNSGLYAIEPFTTKGNGKIYEGGASGIYIIQDEKNIRGNEAREILNYLIEEYQTLPFCARWLVKKFGTKVLIYLRQLEANGNLHQYPQLIEASHSKVAQTENTILFDDKNSKDLIVTTE
jgi:methionyl aminopeptidase